eukprot:CAMPEP_0172774880 /NCGR_PEP_ID=MMETSP1074-20121228/196975_1 /TAXON_ID=2916 /ORGANISM="Ceratium fusus, Strain PA161109" /LENGTH=117 /DNA_ID=CAMNT_0013611389 /DNA_START=442 /DNA_END=792 /DNA_ORIENTATION=-
MDALNGSPWNAGNGGGPRRVGTTCVWTTLPAKKPRTNAVSLKTICCSHKKMPTSLTSCATTKERWGSSALATMKQNSDWLSSATTVVTCTGANTVVVVSVVALVEVASAAVVPEACQ